MSEDIKRWLAAMGITAAVGAAMIGLFIVGSRIVWGEWPW